MAFKQTLAKDPRLQLIQSDDLPTTQNPVSPRYRLSSLHRSKSRALAADALSRSALIAKVKGSMPGPVAVAVPEAEH